MIDAECLERVVAVLTRLGGELQTNGERFSVTGRSGDAQKATACFQKAAGVQLALTEIVAKLGNVTGVKNE